jgi:hypothetical protein
MRRRTARVPPLSLTIVSLGAAGLSACSSQETTGSNPGAVDSGSTDPADTDSGVAADSGPTNGGESVLPADAAYLIWKDNGGGFVLSPPPGAACPYMALYELDLQAKRLFWSVCTGNDPVNPTAYSTKGASRALTADELTQALAAAHAVTISDRMLCGADKPSLTLEIGAPSTGTIIYGDDFYACQKMYDHYVTSSTLDQLGVVLRGMAHSP